MNTFYQLLAILGAFLIIWILYRQIKAHPERFAWESMNKSLLVMGLLALGLIVFTAFLVLLVRL